MAKAHYVLEFDMKTAKGKIVAERKYGGRSIGEARKYAYFEILANHNLAISRMTGTTVINIVKVNEDRFGQESSRKIVEAFLGDRYGNIKAVFKGNSAVPYEYSRTTSELKRWKA